MFDARPQAHWRHIAAALASATILWAIAAYLLLPSLVESIYRHESLPSLNDLLRGPIIYPLEHYLTQWNRIALGILPILLLMMLIPLCPPGRYEIALLMAVLALSAAVRLPGLVSRATWADEGISMLQTSATPWPSWPRTPTPAGSVKHVYSGMAPLVTITEDLRRSDIHPPVYYYSLALWRRWLGFSIETARLLSLLYSVGTVLALYLLLRAGGMERRLVPTVVYAMSTCAVFFGSTARDYALASLLITLASLFGYLACKAVHYSRAHTAAYSVAMALCCGLAFQTHYFSLFPVGAILGWYFINLWRGFRTVAIASPLLSISIGLVGVPTLMTQLGARPTQNVGFPGWAIEAKMLLRANLAVLWDPMYNNRVLQLIAVVGIPALIGVTMYHIVSHRRGMNRKLWALLLALGAAPSLGLLVLDPLFNKQNTYSVYLLFAGAALAVIVSYPITIVESPWLRLGAFLGVVAMAMDGINWGFEEGPVFPPQVSIRSLARAVKASASRSAIVVIDEGSGRAPASVVYELDPQTLMLCFGRGSDPEKLWAEVRRYQDVWLVSSFDETPETINIRDQLVERLVVSGSASQATQKPRVMHFRKDKTAYRYLPFEGAQWNQPRLAPER
jgi:hypothetical protein